LKKSKKLLYNFFSLIGSVNQLGNIDFTSEGNVLTFRLNNLSEWTPIEGFYQYNREIYEPTDPTESFALIEMSFDSKYYIISSYGGGYQIFDIKKEEKTHKVIPDGELNPTGMVLSSIDHHLACKNEKSIQIWNYESNKKIWEWTTTGDFIIQHLIFLPKSPILMIITFNDKDKNYMNFSRYDYKTLKLEKPKKVAFDTTEFSIFISPDEKYLIFFYNSTSVISVWNFKAFQILYEIKLAKDELVSKLFFTHDSKRFIVVVSSALIKSTCF
jgi:WD40 repeat protein